MKKPKKLINRSGVRDEILKCMKEWGVTSRRIPQKTFNIIEDCLKKTIFNIAGGL